MIEAGANLGLWKPVLVLGVLQAGLYGLLPVAFVLSYRISRSVAFVHGGIAGACGFVYFVLVYDGTFVPGPHPKWPPWLGLLAMVALGAGLGGAYGAVVLSRRLARLPAMTHVVISLGTMMILFGIVTRFLLVHPGVLPPGPFGEGRIFIADTVVTSTRLGTFTAATLAVAALAWFLARSQTGMHIRAVCDDLDASTWCGVNVGRLGTGVHAVAGAIAGLAGPLIITILGPDPLALFQVILRGLAVAVIGGLLSLPLALVGALVVGVVESALAAGMFGQMSIGRQELLLNAALLALILTVARVRRNPFALLERRTL